jgi:hypothetical protein
MEIVHLRGMVANEHLLMIIFMKQLKSSNIEPLYLKKSIIALRNHNVHLKQKINIIHSNMIFYSTSVLSLSNKREHDCESTLMDEASKLSFPEIQYDFQNL